MGIKKFILAPLGVLLAALCVIIIATVKVNSRAGVELPARDGLIATTSLVQLHGTGTSTVFVSRTGKTIYEFGTKSMGQNYCYGECALVWPPVLVLPGDTIDADVPGNFGTLVRTDGLVQMVWKGKPLHYYSKDTLPGEMRGDGEDGGLWHAVRPLE